MPVTGVAPQDANGRRSGRGHLLSSIRARRAVTEQFRRDIHRLEDTRRFLERASAACVSPTSLSRELMERHSDVQRGKFDKGRRKMPWLEVTADRIGLTMTRVGGLDREATVPSNIAPHPYRLASADALIMAARGA